MAREINTKRIEAERLYRESKGQMKLIDISKQLDVPEGTIRGWKNRDKWNAESNATLQNKTCSVADKKRSVTNSKKKVAKDEKEKVAAEKIIEIDNDLTDKQKLFCIYYIKYFNSTKAYQKAYHCGYDAANANGNRLIAKDSIQLEIKRLKADKFKGAFLEKGDILQRYIDIALADITDFLEFGQKEITIQGEEGKGDTSLLVNYVDLKDSSEIDGTMISEVSSGKAGVKLKLHDKMKALEFLANNIGLLDVATQEKIDMERKKFEYLQQDKGDKTIIVKTNIPRGADNE